jgi:3-phosphoshikimate 1-carboxyvinyltransferase
MNKLILPSKINGEIIAPTSKSALQRIIAAAVLADGASNISYQTLSEDAGAILQMASALGKTVSIEENLIHISGNLKNPAENVSVGESGLGLRMMLPILAATHFPFTISGRGSLVNRPVDFVVKTLEASGVHVNCANQSLPIRIQGPIKKDVIRIDGNYGSQLLTGFLMAAPLLDKEIAIEVDNLKSKPYIDLTIDILHKFGIQVTHQSYKRFNIPGHQKYNPTDVCAEGDWSGAAFALVAGAISGSIRVSGINPASFQGDKLVLDVLRACGAHVEVNIDTIRVSKNQLLAFEFDATDAPDLFPPLVALAVHCTGTSVIKGVSRLKHKESDRGYTLKTEFSKIGAQIRIENDLMLITGCKINGGRVSSHHDHRIAMALAVAALNANGTIQIENAEAVGKSWPDFFDILRQIGAEVVDE